MPFIATEVRRLTGDEYSRIDIGPDVQTCRLNSVGNMVTVMNDAIAVDDLLSASSVYTELLEKQSTAALLARKFQLLKQL